MEDLVLSEVLMSKMHVSYFTGKKFRHVELDIPAYDDKDGLIYFQNRLKSIGLAAAFNLDIEGGTSYEKTQAQRIRCK